MGFDILATTLDNANYNQRYEYHSRYTYRIILESALMLTSSEEIPGFPLASTVELSNELTAVEVEVSSNVKEP